MSSSSSKVDLYQILGVPHDADEATIRKEYKKLALQWHPDRNKAANASAKFQEISRAYDILGNADKRKIYDKYGEDGVRAAAAGHDPSQFANSGSGSGSASDDEGYSGTRFSQHDAEELFRRFFGGGGVGGGGMNMGMGGMNMGMGGMNMGMGGRDGATFFSFGGGRPKMARGDFGDGTTIFTMGGGGDDDDDADMMMGSGVGGGGGGGGFFQQHRNTPFGFQQQSFSSSSPFGFHQSASSAGPFGFQQQQSSSSSRPRRHPSSQQQQQQRRSEPTPAAAAAAAAAAPTTTEPPTVVTHKLPCTLEELANGFSKNFRISRRVQDRSTGSVTSDVNVLAINGQPGWKAGTKVTFADAGDQMIGMPSQDIVFVVEEKEHPRFKRIGDDLETTIHVSLSDALCGTTINIKTLEGRMVKLNVPHVTPDTTRVISGEGMPKKKGGKGDMIVKFKIEFPVLDEVQKDAIRQVLPKS